ncbi:lamin tail domain-containing protein [Pontiellaceae bacterium B12219]|nr:lamin tail domain-containing protein [Pontiellaceae bacterium B12219]
MVLLVFFGPAAHAQEQVADTRFSINRGFYSVATNLVISTDTIGSIISYTLDGSDPRTSTNTFQSTAPATVLIDPDNGTGKWKPTPAVMVRAYAHKEGMLPSNVDTHTYLFISKVQTQGDIRPDGNTVFWNSTEMDPDVVNNPAYSGELDEALLSIPSLSIVMNHEDLFGPAGMHRSNTMDEEAEMPCSLELIYPDTPHFAGFSGFQIDCGLKNQGASDYMPSYGGYDHKQSFGLRFRREYGNGQLDYPFFEHAPLNSNSEAGSYDKLILRAGHNKSYGMLWDAEHTVYTRDQLARDMQIDMTGIGGHGSFVHLYLNGIYWGLYNPCEKQDDAFAASYLGGNEQDYFCFKGKGGNTAGNNTRFYEWLNTASKSPDLSTLLEYCNIDNHADSVMFSIYAAIADFPQYYADIRNNPGGQVYFFNWDAEDSLGGGSRRSEGDNPSLSTISNDRFAGFDNMWDNNAEYRMNFVDRIYKACFNGGALTDDHVLENWNRLCDTIYSAMVAESARWGDEREAETGTTYTRDEQWVAARDAVTSGTAGKRDRLIALFRSSEMYPDINPPLFLDGTTEIDVARKEVPAGFDLTIDRDGSAGTVYYTINGTDPRAEGGAALGIDAGTGTTITLNTTTCVKARTLDGETWSALHETLFFVERDWNDLKITEIMYNPQDALMASGATLTSITGDAGFINPNYTNRARLIFSDTLPVVLTGGDKVRISGATNPINNGTFTIAKVIYEGPIGENRTKEVLLTEALADENSGEMTCDFLYDGDRYEFVEVKNTGESPLPLSGVTFTRGIKYTFPNAITLAPGGFAVLARNPWDFEQRYPSIPPIGSFPASTLDNKGERLELALATDIRYDINGIVTTSEGNGAVFLQTIPSSIGPGDRMQISLSDHYSNNRMFTIKSVNGNIVFVNESLPTEPQGAKAYFFDVITSVEYGDSDPWPLPADGYGFSLTPTNSNPSGSQDIAGEWRASALAHGSPGADDPLPENNKVVVNEILTHTDKPQRDTIELYNPGNQAVDLSGWFLTDNEDLPQKWTIPTGTVIPANGYQVLYEGHYVDSVLEFTESEFGSAFSLSAAGDNIYLFSPTLGYSHGFSFEGAYNGISFGRHLTSQGEEHFPSQQSFTPMAANSGPAVGPVVISEIMYNPTASGHEYIELLNISENSVPLYDTTTPSNVWKVGGIDFQFPENNISIGPGEIILLIQDSITPQAFRSEYSIPANVQIFSYSGKLSNSGESVTLRAPDEPVRSGSNAGEEPYIIIDRITYSDDAPWPAEADGSGQSLERITTTVYGNDAANWRSSTGTPGIAGSDSPTVVDNDHDGLDDNWELTYFSSTNHPNGGPGSDFDLDGQSNFDEYISGTNPTNANSRFALMLEADENNENPHFTISWEATPDRVYDVLWAPRLGEGFQYLKTGIAYPQNSYTDTEHSADGSCYYRVLVRMPMPGDLDADGLPDSWESRYFASADAKAEIDSDGDLLNNVSEYIAGTDPANAASVLRFTSAQSSPAGVILEWDAVTGRVYRVHWSEDLNKPFRPLSPWMPFPQEAYTDTVHSVQQEGFYDLRVELDDEPHHGE